MYNLRTLSLSIIILCAISCKSPSDSKSIAPQKDVAITLPKDWKTLDTTEYSISYPPTWNITQTGEMSTAFFIKSPAESQTDLFSENINLLITAAPNVTSKAFIEASLEQIKNYFTNLNITKSEIIKESGEDVVHLMYSADQGKNHLNFEQKAYLKNDKAYILTYTSGDKISDKIKTEATSVLNSFKVK